ncbi:MAG: succinyldiaminopimelate transaminase [Gammaproteobacteria bacterium]|nr:succinyldiaminopimelate transaminase [Gammaproteobacteria bacterium]
MNPGFRLLEPYPFERLAALRRDLREPAHLSPINLSIGEPQHPTPSLIHDALIAALASTAKYPATKGSDELRAAIAQWLARRFGIPADSVDPSRNVLPVNGTREALFAIVQAVVNPLDTGTLVLMPNPFYQIYEGAAFLAGATPYYLPCPAEKGFLPDLTAISNAVWDRCALLYICSPSNPAGTVMDLPTLQFLLELSDRHNFVIVADECYSELYRDEAAPPPGLLQAAWAAGRVDYRNCLAMHSLSKRSNAPGLRSGFVAGDPALIETFLRYRAYHGSAMPNYVQQASIAAWSDEAHVRENRRLYTEKFTAVATILNDTLDITVPAGGFYLWPEVPLDDVTLCRKLIEDANVTTLPGQFLARTIQGHNPGSQRLRIALVAELAQCVEAAQRMRAVLRAL